VATKLDGQNNAEATPTNSFQFEVYSREGRHLPHGKVGFSSVEGLSDETEAVEYKDGNDLYARKLPGMTKGGEITLKKGIDYSGWLWEWRKQVREGTWLPQQYQEDIVVVQYDRRGTDSSAAGVTPSIVQAWVLRNAWPSSYNRDDLGASSEIAMESCTFCHDGPPEIFIGRLPGAGE